MASRFARTGHAPEPRLAHRFPQVAGVSEHPYASAFLVAFVLCVVCWGKNAFTTDPRIDSVYLINNQGTMLNWFSIGRWAISCIKSVIGNVEWVPYYSGAVFLLAFPASAVAWLWLLDTAAGRVLRGRWAFCAAYVLAHWWSYQFYFLLQMAEVAVTLMILPVAAQLAWRALERGIGAVRRFVMLVVAAALLALTFGTYQSFAPLAIAAFSAALMLYADALPRASEEGPSPAVPILRRSIFVIGVFLSALAVYALVTSFFPPSAYLDGQVAWGTLPPLDCLWNVLRYAWHVLCAHATGSSGLFAIGLAFSALCRFALMAGERTRPSQMLLPAVGHLMLCASPFLLALYLGQEPIPRSQIVMPVVAAILIVWSFDFLSSEGRAEGATDGHTPTALVLALSVLVVFVSARSLSGIQRDIYTADVLYQQEVAFTGEIVHELERAYGNELDDTPVVFVGSYQPRLNAACSHAGDWAVPQLQFGGMTANTSAFIYAVWGVPLQGPTDEQIEMANELAPSLEVFPREESIVRAGDVIVVKVGPTAEESSG